MKASFVLLVKILASAVGFLAAAADTSKKDIDDITDNYKGGILNYRTGKLDDGTDPIGWYED